MCAHHIGLLALIVSTVSVAHEHTSSAGKPGDPVQVDQTIAVSAEDIKCGPTVVFVRGGESEGVFTALLAWFVFRENFDLRIALGMAAIASGAVVLSWPGELRFGEVCPVLAVLGACVA